MTIIPLIIHRMGIYLDPDMSLVRREGFKLASDASGLEDYSCLEYDDADVRLIPVIP